MKPYTIEQVEEILQEQRELCAKNAIIEEGKLLENNGFYIQDSYKEKDITEGYDGTYVRRIDQNSILMSKLKIKSF